MTKSSALKKHGTVADKIMEFMKLKAGLLAEGIYFQNDLLNKLNEEEKTMDGTGLFKYSNRKRVPNEIIVEWGGKKERIEVRQKNNAKNTNFSVSINSHGYTLEDKLTCNEYDISFPILPSYMKDQTNDLKPMKDVMRPMGPDFLRLYPDMRCDYAEEKLRCRFCGGTYKINVHNIRDITETLERAKKDMDIKGVFMSTGAFDDWKRTEFYSNILVSLKDALPNGQIVFALAPQLNREQVNMIYKSGGSNLMLSYNLEAFDSVRWDITSPLCMGLGKAMGGINYYFDKYDYAVKIGGIGSIKSNFIIGLESIESLREGIKKLAERGVSASGTVFYLTPGSIWQQQSDQNPDFYPLVKEFREASSMREFIVESYLTMQTVILSYNLPTPWTKGSRISGIEWDANEYLKSSH